MRKQAMVNTDAGTVVVRELRPRDILNLMRILNSEEARKELNVLLGIGKMISEAKDMNMDLVAYVLALMERFSSRSIDLEAFMKDAKCLQLPDATSIYDLSISEFSALLEAIYELHSEIFARFFPKASAAIEQGEMPPSQIAHLPKPASTPLNAVM